MEIAKRGIFETPALVIDGKVKIAGRMPSKEETKGSPPVETLHYPYNNTNNTCYYNPL
ncbi:MAG: thioredoxin family protein [Thermoplasmata archaeon]|nr:thioredoxin family protein [Thermoplasmata archaeon]